MRNSTNTRPIALTGTSVVGLLLCMATPSLPYPTGAPFTACVNMLPGHGSRSEAPNPYTISFSGATKYQAGDTISVTISGPQFKGIMMQVREAREGARYTRGTFTEPPDGSHLRTQQCDKQYDTITHSSNSTKQNVTFTWTAPDDITEDLRVIATVAEEKEKWWKNIESTILMYDFTTTTSTTTTTTTATPTTTTTTTIGTTDSSSDDITGMNHANLSHPGAFSNDSCIPNVTCIHNNSNVLVISDRAFSLAYGKQGVVLSIVQTMLYLLLLSYIIH